MDNKEKLTSWFWERGQSFVFDVKMKIFPVFFMRRTICMSAPHSELYSDAFLKSVLRLLRAF